MHLPKMSGARERIKKFIISLPSFCIAESFKAKQTFKDCFLKFTRMTFIPQIYPISQFSHLDEKSVLSSFSETSYIFLLAKLGCSVM